MNSFTFDLLFFFIQHLIYCPIARGKVKIETRIKLFINQFNQTNYRSFEGDNFLNNILVEYERLNALSYHKTSYH